MQEGEGVLSVRRHSHDNRCKAEGCQEEAVLREPQEALHLEVSGQSMLQLAASSFYCISISHCMKLLHNHLLY